MLSNLFVSYHCESAMRFSKRYSNLRKFRIITSIRGDVGLKFVHYYFLHFSAPGSLENLSFFPRIKKILCRMTLEKFSRVFIHNKGKLRSASM